VPVEAEVMRSGFWAGFLTDILDSKVGVFFVSFLPGFVPAGQSVGWGTLGFGVWYAVLTAVHLAAPRGDLDHRGDLDGHRSHPPSAQHPDRVGPGRLRAQARHRGLTSATRVEAWICP
jgi:hypothetical protein